jgi:hypothetical protein
MVNQMQYNITYRVHLIKKNLSKEIQILKTKREKRYKNYRIFKKIRRWKAALFILNLKLHITISKTKGQWISFWKIRRNSRKKLA